MTLLVVSCGGTISSTQVDAAAAEPRLGAAQLVLDIPGLADHGEVQTQTFSTVASSAMQLDDIVSLTAQLRCWVDAAEDVALGIVVTHGTDTLEEMAYGVDLLWDRDVPVVFTGAMRHTGLTSPDGPANLAAAAATATSPDARGCGVLVVFDDRIHLASTVRKVHTHDRAAFGSPTLGPAGYIAEGRARVVMRPQRRPAPVPSPTTSLHGHPVALVSSYLGDDGRLLEAVVQAGFSGVVIEALGGGHLPPVVAASPALAALLEKGPVVLASRTGAGETLRSTYGFPGSETDLLTRGLLPAGTLTGPRARILLSLMLAGGATRDGIAAAVTEHGR